MAISLKTKKWFCENFFKLLLTKLWFTVVIWNILQDLNFQRENDIFSFIATISVAASWFVFHKWKQEIEKSNKKDPNQP